MRYPSAARAWPLLLAALLALALAAALPASGSARPAHARTASSCRLSGKEESLGPTYVTYLGVSGGASCSQGVRLVRSFYHCRLSHGGRSGHCSSVEGFRCSERRYLVITVQFSSHVTCTRGRETVRHDYTQFT